MPKQTIVGITFASISLIAVIILKNDQTVFALGFTSALYAFQCLIERREVQADEAHEKRLKDIESKINGISLSQSFKK